MGDEADALIEQFADGWFDDQELDELSIRHQFPTRKKNTMPRTSSPITLREVLELTPGDKDNPSWINGTLNVELFQPKKIKDTMWGAQLRDLDDPDVKIEATFFGRKALPASGSVVDLEGSMQRTEYNGRAQITCFAKCQVNAVGRAPERHDNHEDAREARSSSERNAAPAGRSAPPTQADRSKAVPGVTVGMALNNACNLIGRTLDIENAGEASAYLASTAFSQDLYRIASDIVRVGRVMEAGQLVDSPKNRAQRQEPPPPAREEPRRADPPAPARQAAPVEEEDVPF